MSAAIRYTPAVFYGWVILAIGMVAIIATSPGQSFLVGKFSASIEASLGLSETTLTAAYGIATFASAISLLFVGRLSDRFGPRLIMGVAALLLGGACWAIGYAQGPITLGICYFLLRFFGQGAMPLAANHSLAMWFERRLGTASGILFFAVPTAIFALPTLTTWLINAVGWRLAYGLLGVAVWATMLPLVLLLHRNRPEDIGQRVDGVAAPPDAPPQSHPHAHPDAVLIAADAIETPPPAAEVVDDRPECPPEICFSARQTLTTSAYWIITLGTTLAATISTVLVFMLSKLTSAAGLPVSANDVLLAVFGVAAGVFSPLAGVLTDRVPPRWLIASGALQLSAACACFALAGTWPLAWLAMICLATGQMTMFIVGGTLLARFFGRPHQGAIRATQTFIVVTGTSIGPYLCAVLAGPFGYAGALWVFAAAGVPIVLWGLTLHPPRQPGR